MRVTMLTQLTFVVADPAHDIAGADDVCRLVLNAFGDGIGPLKSTRAASLPKPVFTINAFGSRPSGSLMCSRLRPTNAGLPPCALLLPFWS